MTRLGSWQTYFPISERNYFGANIWLPAQIINGTVLKPGQRFEWWSGLGPVTTARGFGLGGFIAGDHTDPTGRDGRRDVLELDDAVQRRAPRRAHDGRPRRTTATTSPAIRSASTRRCPARQTMSFTNDMKTPILIRGVKIRGGGGAGYVRFEIWGTR